MKEQYIYTSLTRIADLHKKDFEIRKLSKEHWETGDYVVCEIIDPGSSKFMLELKNGRMRGIMGGEHIIGALGERFATLEATGSWRYTEDDGKMHLLTSAGLLGKLTSKSVFIPGMIETRYLGHAFRDGGKLSMEDYIKPVPDKEFNIPVVLLVGTSMSAGKTTSARIVTKLFKEAGLNVVAAKLSGAGRYKDILAMKDVGADSIIDFVDAGLPSSIYPRNAYKEKIEYLKSAMANTNADVAVIEIGASPLEPYNGDIAIEAIREQIKCIILAASDPYAVVGLMKAFDITPDIVTGISTNTLAGSELIRKLSGLIALNLIDPGTIPALKEILNDRLGFKL